MAVPVVDTPTADPSYHQTQFLGVTIYCDAENHCYVSRQDAHILDMFFTVVILLAAVRSIR
jgi:hypothetical protein